MVSIKKRIFIVALAVLIFVVVFKVTSHKASLRYFSTAMEPTIGNDDTILVDYSAYRTRRPTRWEIVIYEMELPQGGTGFWVFRVVGLPGEKIKIEEGGIFVNDERLEVPKDLSHLSYLPREVLEGSVSEEPTQVYSVPEKSYFLLGDNSKRAADSRFYGPVSFDRLKGAVKRKCSYSSFCVWYDLLCTWGPEWIQPADCDVTTL